MAIPDYEDSIINGKPQTYRAEREMSLPDSAGSPSQFVRPLTRGELRDRLNAGERCEVAASTAEITAILLEGWLGVKSFCVTKSPNSGWVIFGPKVEPLVICSECGKEVTSGNVFHYGEAKPLMAVFCSRVCAEKYNPSVLTMEKILGLCQWFPSGSKRQD